MTTNYLEKLEYFKILEILSNYCNTYIGKEKALSLLPSSDKNIVQNLLNETEEAVNLVYRNSTPSIPEINNIDDYLITLNSYGSLSAKALLNLANIFKISENLKKYFYKDYIDETEYQILSTYFSNLYSNSSITKKIFDSIIDENTISDNASNNLNKIRKDEKKIEQDIKNKLTSILHSSSYSKYIQENIFTIRNDRFVIPVKEEYRGNIKGFIHDMSSTGSTVFIEPISIFELNNKLNNLKIEENIEIDKILQDLSKLFYPFVDTLKLDLETIGQLDFIFAKAKYSKILKATTPFISDQKQFNFVNAKHPLLNQDTAVPISVSLGKDFSCLLITGPNTGGKTVTLKTIGLLTCMACSGLNIPVDNNSSIFVFDKIFADIGDDQSISDSLSTFSSHMLNIVDILNTSNENSLILVDELGSGTDPLEGANLAISILETFKRKNSLVVATTHYQELKKYALVTEGFENASVEFDLSTLSPTYHLLLGIPGKSNAFAISEKLGLNKEIIDRAKSLISSEEINFEELLKNIYDDKSKIEKEKVEISEKLENIKSLEKELEKDNSELKMQEKNIIQNAKREARNILLEAKEEANSIIKEMNKHSSNSELNNLRNKINKKISEISIEDIKIENANTIPKENIKPNTTVFVTNLNQNGIVLSNISKQNEVQVQIGSIKMNINIKNLAYPKEETKKKNISTFPNISKSKTVSSELNIIGLTVDEAIPIVDKFLDDCYLSKLETVRIVHGKGTGKLKNGVHQFLKTNPHVKSYRMGTYGEGEMGVTVVTLK
ncbi:MAG: endonuclease MutS2 [Clostridia bacterium]|nr:endonuclease MutS2 [Clostridia bacterium]